MTVNSIALIFVKYNSYEKTESSSTACFWARGNRNNTKILHLLIIHSFNIKTIKAYTLKAEKIFF